MRKISNSSHSIAIFVNICLLGVILFPQGVGFVYFPVLQVRQMCAIAVLILGMIMIIYTGRIKLVAPRSMAILAFIVGLQFLSAFQSESINYSIQWAVNYTIMIWGVAFCYILISGNIQHRRIVCNTLMIISVLLASWATIEYVGQFKLVPYRNIYAETSLAFSTILRRVVLVDGTRFDTALMSIGPFSSNLTYSGFLCAFGGILIFGWRNNLTFNFLGTSLFVFSVMATQSRIGFLSMICMLLISLIIAEKRNKKLAICFGFLFGACAFVCFTGITMLTLIYFESFMRIQLRSVFVSVIILFLSYLFIAFLVKNRNALKIVFLVFLFSMVILAFSARFVNFEGLCKGSALCRIYGVSLLLSQPKSWLLGAGPGSLVDSERVISSIKIFSDQGSFFGFIGESGIMVGILLLRLVYMGILNGLYMDDPFIKGMTIGLIGFFITSLCSVTVIPWVVVVLFVGLIESWKKSFDSKQDMKLDVRLIQKTRTSHIGV